MWLVKDRKAYMEIETLETSNWRKVVELIHTAFRDGRLAEEATWQALVLIPKGGGDFYIIGLVEVLCKTVAAILNCHLGAAINLHNMLHGFWDDLGTGTAYLEVKLLHKLMDIREEVLCAIFMDLHKTYRTLDREIFLGIMEENGVRPWARFSVKD